jgi:hypothetical protein
MTIALAILATLVLTAVLSWATTPRKPVHARRRPVFSPRIQATIDAVEREVAERERAAAPSRATSERVDRARAVLDFRAMGVDVLAVAKESPAEKLAREMAALRKAKAKAG